jgi:DNA-binding CsgD family transcriptional regulator
MVRSHATGACHGLGETTRRAQFREPLAEAGDACATVPASHASPPITRAACAPRPTPVRAPDEEPGAMGGADDHRVVVALRSSVLDHAVRGVLRAEGWTVEQWPPDAVGDPDDERPCVVDDGWRRSAADRTVLVCPATPVGCAQALRRLTAGQVGAVVPDDRITVIPSALTALRRRRSILELDVVDLALLVPDLDARQRAVLEGVLAGQSAKDIAAGAYLSLATVKRTLSDLFRLFGVRSGLQLTRRASSLGYQPRAVVGPLP